MISMISKRKSKPVLVIIILLNMISPSNANASAGWYPTKVGDYIDTDFCVPAGTRSPVFLQTMQGKTIAVIKFKILKVDSYCRNEAKYGFSQTGQYHLKYRWQVNIKGSWGLRLRIPNLKSTVYGWPDGIEANKGH